MESRVAEAVALFESGYNCAQSVFATYADLFGMDKEAALRLSSPMGAGIGRMREVCGTVSGMSLLLGLKEGNADATDEAAKKRVYEVTRRMADRFKEENGSIICRELLGIVGREQSAAPSKRTQEYYMARPCSRLVASAAQIVETVLLTTVQP